MGGNLRIFPHHCSDGIRLSWVQDTTRIAPSGTCRSCRLLSDRRDCRYTDRLVIFDNGVAIVSSKTENHEIELNQTDIDRIIQLFEQGTFLDT